MYSENTTRFMILEIDNLDDDAEILKISSLWLRVSINPRRTVDLNQEGPFILPAVSC